MRMEVNYKYLQNSFIKEDENRVGLEEERVTEAQFSCL